MRYGRTTAIFAVLVGLGVATAPAAHAQEVPPPAAAEIEVTPELLERFVEVYPDVMGIAQNAQVELATAETAEEAQAIQLEAQQEIQAVLEEAEFTVEDYEAIVGQLNEDEELRTEFERLLEARMLEDRDG